MAPLKALVANSGTAGVQLAAAWRARRAASGAAGAAATRDALLLVMATLSLGCAPLVADWTLAVGMEVALNHACSWLRSVTQMYSVQTYQIYSNRHIVNHLNTH